MDPALRRARYEVESDTDRFDASGLQSQPDRAFRAGLRGAATDHFICDFKSASHRQIFAMLPLAGSLPRAGERAVAEALVDYAAKHD